MAETTREDREAAALACGYPFDRWPHDFHPEASAAWRERGELLRPWGAWVEMDDVAHAIAKSRTEGAAAALADPGKVLEAAQRLLSCAVNDHTGLIATALANGAEISLAIRNDEREEARRA